MILVSLKKTFPTRACEWMLTGMMISWGVVAWNIPATSWDEPIYSGLYRIADQQTWGFLVCTFGFIRFLALFRNGGWRPSPHLRAGCAFLACFVWLQVSLGLFVSDLASFGWAIYPWLLAADIYNTFRAGQDAGDSEERRRNSASERSRVSSAYEPARN